MLGAPKSAGNKMLTASNQALNFLKKFLEEKVQYNPIKKQ